MPDATNGTAVLERIRAALADAEEAGVPRPGRPALVTLTGATEHQVRQALAALDTASGRRSHHQLGRQRPRRQLVSRPASGVASESAGDLQVPAGDQLETSARQAGGHLVAVPSSPPVPGEPGPGAPARQPITSTAPSSVTAGGAAPGARLVAWLGFVFGSLMSIAANVLHTWLPPEAMPAGWSPGIAPQIGAAVWPVALLLSVEVLSRVAWRRGFWWTLARYGGAGAVAVGSAVISYGHLREVLLAWGYGRPGADVGPLVLDGLMVVSGFALLAMSGHQRQQSGCREDASSGTSAAR